MWRCVLRRVGTRGRCWRVIEGAEAGQGAPPDWGVTGLFVKGLFLAGIHGWGREWPGLGCWEYLWIRGSISGSRVIFATSLPGVRMPLGQLTVHVSFSDFTITFEVWRLGVGIRMLLNPWRECWIWDWESAADEHG
jgi:hypothetical protein